MTTYSGFGIHFTVCTTTTSTNKAQSHRYLYREAMCLKKGRHSLSFRLWTPLLATSWSEAFVLSAHHTESVCGNNFRTKGGHRICDWKVTPIECALCALPLTQEGVARQPATQHQQHHHHQQHRLPEIWRQQAGTSRLVVVLVSRFDWFSKGRWRLWRHTLNGPNHWYFGRKEPKSHRLLKCVGIS